MRAETGSNRVIRGGNFNNNAQNLRSANRNRNDPGNRNNNIGVRLLSTGLVPGEGCPWIVLPCSRSCPGPPPAPVETGQKAQIPQRLVGSEEFEGGCGIAFTLRNNDSSLF